MVAKTRIDLPPAPPTVTVVPAPAARFFAATSSNWKLPPTSKARAAT